MRNSTYNNSNLDYLLNPDIFGDPYENRFKERWVEGSAKRKKLSKKVLAVLVGMVIATVGGSVQ